MNRAPRRLVTKADLLEHVWDGAFVTDNALDRAVARLRKALDDDVRAPRFLETVPTLGYRFVAEVTSESLAAGVVADPRSSPGSDHPSATRRAFPRRRPRRRLPRVRRGPARVVRSRSSSPRSPAASSRFSAPSPWSPSEPVTRRSSP